MKLVGAISTAVLSLTLGVGIPAYAQQEQHDQQEENKRQACQDEKKAQPEKSAKPEDKNVQQEEKDATAGQEQRSRKKNAQQQDKNNKQEEKNAQQQDQERPAGKQKRTATLADRLSTAQQASAAMAAAFPTTVTRPTLDSEHRFRVSQSDYSNRRFQYGGYWFGFVDAWPSNWLYTQDVFVVEIDGVYYLCNASYPGVNIELSVTQ